MWFTCPAVSLSSVRYDVVEGCRGKEIGRLVSPFWLVLLMGSEISAESEKAFIECKQRKPKYLDA